MERFDSFCSLAAARLYLKCAIVLLHLPDVCSWRMLHFCLYFKIVLLREYLLTVGVDRLIDFQKFICGDFLTALKKDVTLRSRPLQDFTDKLVNMYF